MEQLIELLKQIQELSGVAIEALEGAKGPGDKEPGKPEGKPDGPPEGKPDGPEGGKPFGGPPAGGEGGAPDEGRRPEARG